MLRAIQRIIRNQNFKLTLELRCKFKKKQAIELTQNPIKEGAQTIVACGGDGTINEIASCLVGTNIKLGIIPIGSGNGLASHLMIPQVLKKAIEVIKNDDVVTIDVGRINEQYFFSNTGMGFDANVIKNYEALKKKNYYRLHQGLL